jgi:hypothetical protein
MYKEIVLKTGLTVPVAAVTIFLQFKIVQTVNRKSKRRGPVENGGEVKAPAEPQH